MKKKILKLDENRGTEATPNLVIDTGKQHLESKPIDELDLFVKKYTVEEIALITPIDSLLVYLTNTDLTFTSVGFWGYENGTWVKF